MLTYASTYHTCRSVILPLGWQMALRIALAAMFLFNASVHWGRWRADLIRKVPTMFSRPDLLVTLTGTFEILGAIGLLVPSLARFAATGTRSAANRDLSSKCSCRKRGGDNRGESADTISSRNLYTDYLSYRCNRRHYWARTLGAQRHWNVRERFLATKFKA